MSQAALVTGSSSRIGQILIPQLVTRGFHVYAGYSSCLPSASQSITPYKLDVTSDSDCQKVIQKIKHIDVLVNIAGISQSSPASDLSVSNLERMLDINVVGAFRLIKLAIPHMAHGKIINIASLSAHVSFPNYSLYSASKFALRGLSLGLYHELLPQKISVTCISPGAISSPASIPKNSARARIPLLRFLLPLTPPQQVVRAVLSVIDSSHPPPEILVGRDAVILSLLFRYLPSNIWHTLQRLVWQKQQ